VVTGVRCGRDADLIISGRSKREGTTIRSSSRVIHTAPSTALGRNPISKRRSSRMALHASVGLSGEDRQKAAFTMPAKATNLNKHGAIVQLNRDLPIGCVVVVKNQRGAQVSARVVSQLSGGAAHRTYGIEFVEKDEQAVSFWGISFPTA
jgi:hypothetical protein